MAEDWANARRAISETAAKSKLAGRSPAQPRRDLARAAARPVGEVPILPPRNKDMHSERAVLGSHRFDDGFRLARRKAVRNRKPPYRTQQRKQS